MQVEIRRSSARILAAEVVGGIGRMGERKGREVKNRKERVYGVKYDVCESTSSFSKPPGRVRNINFLA